MQNTNVYTPNETKMRDLMERGQYAKALEKQGLPVHEITSDVMDIDDSSALRLSTMHRIKGLEFDHVCLAGNDRARDLH